MEDVASNQRATATLGLRKTAAINSEHAVFCLDGEVYSLRLKCLDAEPQHLVCPHSHRWHRPAISLSRISPALLAIADSFQVYIFDLDSHHVKHVIPGNARTITSLSLCGHKIISVATGHIDGSICFWNLDNLSRPYQRLKLSGETCDALELSTVNTNSLASLYGGRLHIWNFIGDRWLRVGTLNGVRCNAFSWHPRIAGRLVISTSDRKLCLYDLSDAIKYICSTAASDSSEEESDGGVFPADDVVGGLQPVSELVLDAPLRSVSWAGNSALIGFAEGGETGMFCGVGENDHALRELWRCEFETVVEDIGILQGDERAYVLGIGAQGASSHDIPDSLADFLDVYVRQAARVTATDVDYPEQSNEDTSANNLADGRTSPLMVPVAIASQEVKSSAFPKTSKQLQLMRRMSSFRTKPKSTPVTEQSIFTPQATSASPRSPALHSEVDSAIFEADDDFGSPMPFLSPGIPSTRALPHDIPLLSDSAITPPKLSDRLQNAFETSRFTAPAAGPDTDDSDDETFVDDMHGTAAFLPGGINVPLPKACGALFAPNGQLLTFFPPKPKPAKQQEENDRPAQYLAENERVTRLFPTLGSLELLSGSTSEDSDSDHFDPAEDEKLRLGSKPRFTFQPASFPNQHSWKARDAVAHPAVYMEQPRHRIIVNVHEIEDVPSLQGGQRSVAQAYRLFCRNDESGAELCECNAAVADSAGLNEIGEIWRLLSMLLSDRIPLSALSYKSVETDMSTVAREAMSLGRSDSGVGLSNRNKESGISGKLQWADHPFGGSWLVRRILAWAEDRADIQSLACFSAILSEAQYSSERSSAEQSMLTHLATYSPETVKEASHNAFRVGSRQVIPILRTHSATITSLHESPTKVPQSSELSSSLASQTSMNYSDSSTTPPFPSPLLSRQSTRLSASGSSSPEFQRGSFSTAARYYASSFSEKFGYGTSPPVKKADSSPTTSNELSTSLPGGSWPGKSVSFAPTTTDSSTQRSLSTRASRNGIVEDVGYDSDKTIEDSSLPYSTKSTKGNVAVNLSNHDVFADENRESIRAKVMPDELASRIVIWNSYYAEQLRSWELLAQASELDKVFGLTTGVQLGFEFESAPHDGLLPKLRSKHRNTTCEICLVATKGIMQICPACLHSSHLHCLEQFCADLLAGEFTCPSGCGCTCADLPFLVQEIERQSPQRPTFKKKASFTDPRRWRARNEGDSW